MDENTAARYLGIESPREGTLGTLERLESSHRHLRTDSITGMFAEPPRAGVSFSMVGESLTPEMDLRLVITSPVLDVEIDAMSYTFRTRNSTYRLTPAPSQE
jgi:hypothetical protein